MKRFALVTLAALALSAAPAMAQVSVYGGGGPAIVIGDAEDAGVDNGVMLFGGLTFDVSEMLSLYAEGAWGTHDSEADVTFNPSSLYAGLLLGLTSDEDAALSPYIFGGVGVQTLSADVTGDPSESGFGIQAGAGVGFDLAGVGAFLEGRYHRASYDEDSDFDDLAFQLFTIALGLSFDLGGDN